MTNIIKKSKNTLLEKEKKLGLILLLPTILIVLSVAVFIGFSLGFLSKWVNNKIKKKK